MWRMILRGDERGATAVVVAIMLVVLVGFGALAVDVGALWWDKKQSQNGADAAALAVAQDCAAGKCKTAGEKSAAEVLADKYAVANKLENTPIELNVDYPTSNSVQVTVGTERQHWLAPLIGIGSSTVRAAARAEWGPIGGAKVLPLTISMCDIAAVAPGKPFKVIIKSGGGSKFDPCAGSPTSGTAPGNWGWLTPESGTCLVQTTVDKMAPGSPGNGGHGTWKHGPCKEALRHLKGTTILIPVHDHAGVKGSGSHVEYPLIGYAAIEIASYCLDGSSQWYGGVDKCTGSEQWIEGTFVEFVEIGAEIDPDAEDFDVRTVQLKPIPAAPVP